MYPQPIIIDRIARLLNELASYYLHKNEFSAGFDYLIHSLVISSTTNNKTCIIRNVGLFELFREHATSETNSTYKNLINEVYKDEKKTIETPLVK